MILIKLSYFSNCHGSKTSQKKLYNKFTPTSAVFKGKLLNKAKEKVKVDYLFAKGKSRSKGAESPEISQKAKRAKVHAEERSHQIQMMQEDLGLLGALLSFKQKQLERACCVSNFKQCDVICKEMMEIRKERASVDQQIAALVKKEAKSLWYHKRGYNQTKKVHEPSKKKQCQDNQQSPPSKRPVPVHTAVITNLMIPLSCLMKA